MKVSRHLSFLILMVGLSSCQNKQSDIVYNKFKEQIENHGMKIDSIDSNGILYIQLGKEVLKVSLENTRRDYARDSNEGVITDLVNTVISYSSELPEWAIAKNDIYISLYPNDHDFQGFPHRQITDEFGKVYVHSGNDKLSWISMEDLKKWDISEDELDTQANINGNIMLDKTPITFDTIDGRKLGMIEAEHETLKGSLLFSPNIKKKVVRDFGFPFYAVIPVRDFCYIFSEKDYDFFSKRLGDTVVKEYAESGYPVTTEILKFTDKGVEAVGKYPVQ